jgi:hypothetical protein
VDIIDANDSTIWFKTIFISEPLPIRIDSLMNEDIACYGDSTGVINISASGGSGSLWYSLQNDPVWSDVGIFDGLVTGKYVVSIRDDSSCMLHTDTMYLSQEDKLPSLVIIGNPYADEYEEITYSVSQTPGSQFEWSVNGGNVIEGNNTNVVTIQWGTAGTGEIGVIETSADGCIGDTTRLSVNIKGLYYDQVSQSGFTIYPNRITDKATIQFPNPSGEKYSLSISDISGRTVREMDNIYTEKIIVDRGILPAGIYIIELRGPDVFKGKIIIR